MPHESRVQFVNFFPVFYEKKKVKITHLSFYWQYEDKILFVFLDYFSEIPTNSVVV